MYSELYLARGRVVGARNCRWDTSRVRREFTFYRMISRCISFFVTVEMSGIHMCAIDDRFNSSFCYNAIIALPDGCTCPLWLKHDSSMISQDAVTTSYDSRQV
jgi:hypothetical protein